ncbi:NAD(P)/FAD-dependent oxidoreductase [Novosphingobium lentum]|uniref:NAD(P)/FAD-dependent oxidoreductase n=1 Tax=Novosphingobium lentum TaxID=145287 RepID=UPI00082A618A|nr:NAD(P)/FAD-dependent oxidoreductase [Novosphingobium lentum]
MERTDIAVIGAGVIGLAVARACAMAGRSVVILEREAQVGTGVSARNSEVIHAGLYYPEGSLKQRLCGEGRERLYRFCQERHVPYRRCGKLVVATQADEVPTLEAIAARAAQAGVPLDWLDPQQARALEPALRCVAALHSPTTGIVDSHALMQALLAEAQDHGALLALRSPADSLNRSADGWVLHSGDTALGTTAIVNAAGLDAWAVAQSMLPLDPRTVPPRFLAKGSYYACAGKAPFSRLIYPVPVPGGLGTHLTLDMTGSARLGPDVEWIDAIDFSVDPARLASFADSARRFWPALDPATLSPAYAGVRPKLSGPGGPPADFAIHGEAIHGLPGLINLFGIESPGLTAALAIADRVSRMLL